MSRIICSGTRYCIRVNSFAPSFLEFDEVLGGIFVQHLPWMKYLGGNYMEIHGNEYRRFDPVSWVWFRLIHTELLIKRKWTLGYKFHKFLLKYSLTVLSFIWFSKLNTQIQNINISRNHQEIQFVNEFTK